MTEKTRLATAAAASGGCDNTMLIMTPSADRLLHNAGIDLPIDGRRRNRKIDDGSAAWVLHTARKSIYLLKYIISVEQCSKGCLKIAGHSIVERR